MEHGGARRGACTRRNHRRVIELETVRAIASALARRLLIRGQTETAPWHARI
jgi:hypothetical protein